MARDDVLEPKMNIEHLLDDLLFGTDDNFLGLKEKENKKKEIDEKKKTIKYQIINKET